MPYCPRLRRMIFGKSETVQTTIRDTKDCFYLYEVPHSTSGKTGDPEAGLSFLTPRPGMWLILMTSNVGFHKIILRRVPLSNPSLNQITVRLDDCNRHGSCQRRVHTRVCSSPTIARYARTERTIPVDQGTPLPAHKTIGDVYIDDLVILSVLQFSNVHVASSSIVVPRADALCDFLQMPHECGQVWQCHSRGNNYRNAWCIFRININL